MSNVHSRNYIQSLLSQVNQLEADLNETTRLKILFGQTLNRLGIFRVSDEGQVEYQKCKRCGYPKHQHEETQGRCPKYNRPKSYAFDPK